MPPSTPIITLMAVASRAMISEYISASHRSVLAKGEQLGVPAGGEALPVIVARRVVEGEGDHYRHGDVKDRVDQHRIKAAPESGRALAAELSAFR
jgi:hypothetical protein